jgi:hypothetical protein
VDGGWLTNLHAVVNQDALRAAIRLEPENDASHAASRCIARARKAAPSHAVVPSRSFSEYSGLRRIRGTSPIEGAGLSAGGRLRWSRGAPPHGRASSFDLPGNASTFRPARPFVRSPPVPSVCQCCHSVACERPGGTEQRGWRDLRHWKAIGLARGAP